jgi:hypothetical protein
MVNRLDLEMRAEQYESAYGLKRTARIGDGKDGEVWKTDSGNGSALKIHTRIESYTVECAAYRRFHRLDLHELMGFRIPRFIRSDDRLLAIEMEFVCPPFVVDFASARLDFHPG